eukprot:TRINITY_DN3930_c0_g1_i1.p2 TRINITY_DN3930_c0_g1~~TRINITY_DN3930_c0_g1_i1.p2  ORF type:complete len:116 (-),score=27.87 TRINITY_DN3930_c0_g1_i1:75-422(-)
MYGLGMYFANISFKSNLYIKDANFVATTKTNRKMLVCDVILSKFLEKKDALSSGDAWHDMALPPDGYDSIWVKGMGVTAIPKDTHGNALAVVNDEYIVFHPFQVLPRFVITFDEQ